MWACWRTASLLTWCALVLSLVSCPNLIEGSQFIVPALLGRMKTVGWNQASGSNWSVLYAEGVKYACMLLREL